jgi:23S rRNA pseudouridine1911/1915/1917 synthase
MRLDAFLRKELPQLSLRELRRALEEGGFRVNRRTGRKGDAVKQGDVVSYTGRRELLADQPVPARAPQVTVLYEDESIMVVEKPAGMATHGFSGRETDSLANHLVAIRPELGTIGSSRWEAGLVHRLDRETSGLVMVAKDQACFAHLRAQFQRRTVEKNYWALVWGDAPQEGSIEYPLVHGSQRRMTALIGVDRKPGKKSWAAITRFRTLARSREFSLLEVDMVTGVMHQIRAHLAALGHPIAGDPLYGEGRPFPALPRRHFLHAFFLSCRHPKSGAVMSWKSPLPLELRQALRTLAIEILI